VKKPELIRYPVAELVLDHISNIRPPDAKNRNAAHRVVISITYLCKGLFSIVVMMMMMEIIMNPMSVPRTTAHLAFPENIADVSAMNRPTANEAIISSTIFVRNVGDLRCVVILFILERSLCRGFSSVNKHDKQISQLKLLETKFPEAKKLI